VNVTLSLSRRPLAVWLISLACWLAVIAPGTARADAVPAGTARKEGQADRLKARYQPNSPHVQAFYRTNGSSDK
jgi:hypothetical protein